MIISASRRTDIPAFYSEWFVNRLNKGEILVPNPRNPKQLGRVRLAPEHVDCIVFWTKNPEPMLHRLDEIDALGYRYYFLFTITSYEQDIEVNLPDKDELLDTFVRFSERLGPERMDWRFDPIFITDAYPLERHLESFDKICRRLKGGVGRCIINFFKKYRHLSDELCEPGPDVISKAAFELGRIAASYDMPLYHCTNGFDLKEFGLNPCACIDMEKVEKITGHLIAAKKDTGQPATCNCMESIDIGMYNTCTHGCSYCYAVLSERRLYKAVDAHDALSPMLSGTLKGSENITDRTRPSLRCPQLKLPILGIEDIR